MDNPEKSESGQTTKPVNVPIILEELTDLSIAHVPLNNRNPGTNELIPIITEKFTYVPSIVAPSNDLLRSSGKLSSGSPKRKLSIIDDDDKLSRQRPVINIAHLFEKDPTPVRHSDADEHPVITLFRTGNSFDYDGDESKAVLDIPSPSPQPLLLLPAPELPQKIRRSTRWNATLNRLSLAASASSSYDWINIPRTSDTFVAVKQWSSPEPTPTDAPLPADVDPLVKYKLERGGVGTGAGGDNIRMKNLENIQNQIALGQTPSGRKLEGYGSSQEEEWIYTRVRCKDEPDFDLFHHLDLGQEGKWPNPYYFYWNWKKLEDGVDEHYKKQPFHQNTNRAKIVEELEKSPNAIPYCRLNANDTDTSDPEDPSVPHVTDPHNPYSLRWKFNEVKEPVTDPVERRYPYLYLHLQGKNYNRYYKCKTAFQDRKRQWRAYFMEFWSRRRTPWAPYPLWYIFWKKALCPIVKRIPRNWKFLSEEDTVTIFYGTMASLYKTQYIAEYDIFPNMDDPVQLSQIALEKALKIKEKFLSFHPDGKAFTDFLKMQKSPAYEKYLEWIGLLCRYQPNKMSQRVRKVFFLNFFNVLSIQTQIWRIPEVENMEYLWEMKNFWERTKGLCGYIELNLEEIYHGILRCNRPHPVKLASVFEENDQTKGLPREYSATTLSLERFDPRIHFALNIGCKSCPPIKIFSLYEQDYQLDDVAKTYVRTKLKIDVDLRVVKLPMLLLWYEKDFGNDQRVMLWYLKRFLLARDALKIRKLVTSKKPIYFRYESFDYRLEPYVRRHPETTYIDLNPHRKMMPLYWGLKF
ncbi:hypothetical protein Ocin01_09834 [Orchesella cincta]|uniref:DUF547 domain-containing protein n=1 Tax=Orchesella cincta TaxID=48709 RepID=A0A1D2MVL3_ORCCI|nr:hypothetical protein Ocin01_09834 [Orchesella cincta]